VQSFNSGPALLLDPCPQLLLCFRYFSDRVLSFCLRPVSDQEPRTYGLCIAGIRGLSPGMLVEMGSNFFFFSGTAA
jgi:hypothetical protein